MTVQPMMRRCVVLAAVVVALLPGVAVAQVPDSWVLRAQLIAGNVWGLPCGDLPEVRFAAADGVHITRGDSGWTYGDCAVYFRSDRRYEWPEFCSTMIHEVGHIAGYRDPTTGDFHSSNPRSVMYGMQTITTMRDQHGSIAVVGADRRCWDRGRRYLGWASARMGWR